MKKIIILLSAISLLLPVSPVYAQDPPGESEEVVCCIICEYPDEDWQIEVAQMGADGFPVEFGDTTEYSALYKGCTVCEECAWTTVPIDCPCSSIPAGTYCPAKQKSSRCVYTRSLSADGFFWIYTVVCTTMVDFDVCPPHTYTFPEGQTCCARNCADLKAEADKASTDSYEVCTRYEELKGILDGMKEKVRNAGIYQISKQEALKECLAGIEEQIKGIELKITALENERKAAKEEMHNLMVERGSLRQQVDEAAASVEKSVLKGQARSQALNWLERAFKGVAKKVSVIGWIAEAIDDSLTALELNHLWHLESQLEMAEQRLDWTEKEIDGLEEELEARQKELSQKKEELETGCKTERAMLKEAEQDYDELKSEWDLLYQELEKLEEECEKAKESQQQTRAKYEECLAAPAPCEVCK